jgi:hypothetical protein
MLWWKTAKTGKTNDYIKECVKGDIWTCQYESLPPGYEKQKREEKEKKKKKNEERSDTSVTLGGKRTSHISGSKVNQP